MRKLKKTSVQMPERGIPGKRFPGTVMLTDLASTERLPDRTVLIMQRYLTTNIETIVSRDEAVALVQACVSHFNIFADECDIVNEDDL